MFMKSSIEGCVRLCNDCPKRSLRAYALDHTVLRQLREQVMNDQWDEPVSLAETDPQDVDGINEIRVASLVDYGRSDPLFTPFVELSRTDTLIEGKHPFPYTTTLDIIERCQGPEKIRRGIFRSVLLCGAYQESLAAIPDDDAQAKAAYVTFLDEEERAAQDRIRSML